jgi:hypothetical protein
MSKSEQCVFWWDGDESHLVGADRFKEYVEMGANIVPPKPNTTSDVQGPDLVNFPFVQQIVRSQCSKRQRVIRRLDGQEQRQLAARSYRHRCHHWTRHK